jgi:hypothetical protein
MQLQQPISGALFAIGAKFVNDFLLSKRIFRKNSAIICKKSIDPSCGSYMFVLHPETGEMVQVESWSVRSLIEARQDGSSKSPVSSAGQNSFGKNEEDGQRVKRRRMTTKVTFQWRSIRKNRTNCGIYDL